MQNKFKKSTMTRFAKEAAWGANQMLNGICMAEEIAKCDIGRIIRNEADDELLLEISKRFAKYARDQTAFDAENSEVQDFQRIISTIVACCDEHDWFVQ